MKRGEPYTEPLAHLATTSLIVSGALWKERLSRCEFKCLAWRIAAAADRAPDRVDRVPALLPASRLPAPVPAPTHRLAAWAFRSSEGSPRTTGLDLRPYHGERRRFRHERMVAALQPIRRTCPVTNRRTNG